jgi:hypothetical protein
MKSSWDGCIEDGECTATGQRGRDRERRRHGGHAIIKKGRLFQYFLMI